MGNFCRHDIFVLPCLPHDVEISMQQNRSLDKTSLMVGIGDFVLGALAKI